MCGIAGIMALTGESGRSFYPHTASMCQAMLHRGPDDGNILALGSACLGHRRLSIIDTTSRGRQPFLNEAQNILLAANGEIYNYQTLRKEFISQGHSFVSDSDSEVILHAYEAYGEDFLHHLRGMFAFSIYDHRSLTLVLARDRFGIKPIYYAAKRGRLIFASEIKALLASGLVERDLDFESLDHYLSLGYVPPPRTIFKEIQALPPAHLLTYQQGRLEIRNYWDITSVPKQLLTSEQMIAGLRHQLEQSIRHHAVSDVEVGAFLSGGMDSSAIVGLWNQILKTPIRSFSIGFDTGPSRLNELFYAKRMAQHFNTLHQEVIIRGTDIRSEVNRFIYAMDQPSFDGINTYFVSKMTHEQGLKVALSGLGADEIFGGYSTFRFIPFIANGLPFWNKIPTEIKISLSGLLAKIMAMRGGQTRAKKMEQISKVSTLSDLYALMRQNLGQEDKSKLYHFPSSGGFPFPEERMEEKSLSPWEWVSYLEMQNYLNWRLLRDTDAMSMAHSLEVRVPFVDHELVEYIWSLPHGWEKKWGYPKRLLKAALKDILPSEILERPKQGFQLPMGDWMKAELREVVEDTLSEYSVNKRGLFHSKGIRELYRGFLQHRYPYESLWQFVVLELWLREYCDKSANLSKPMANNPMALAAGGRS